MTHRIFMAMRKYTWCLSIWVIVTVTETSPYITGNIVFGKPSSNYKGNDQTSLCFHDGSSIPYWQVDLQGYFTINNITLTTCWGLYGGRAKSALITVYQTDPEHDSNAEAFVVGTTPSTFGAQQTLTFAAYAPFFVRYLRVSATVQEWISLDEVEATGLQLSSDNFALEFTQTKELKLQNADVVTRVTSKVECARTCVSRKTCVAFSYAADVVEDNCRLSSDSAVTADVNWMTAFLNPNIAVPKPC